MKSVMSALFFLFLCGTALAQFAGGSGTVTEPYQVASAEHLNNMRNFLSSHFIQTSDIDLGVAPWNSGEGWVPIGSYNSDFTGSFNGNGHTISNLTINRATSDYQALFGAAMGDISNLILTNAVVTGHSYTAALVGYAHDGSDLADCSADGSISGTLYYAGILAGMLYYGTMSDCLAYGTVSGGDMNSGGLVGLIYGSPMIYSQAEVDVSGSSNVGGLAGNSIESSFSHCSASGEVYASANAAGGLFGSISMSSFDNCSSACNVSTDGQSSGGLAGITYSVTISHCRNSGSVYASEMAGGLAGNLSSSTIEKSSNTGNVTAVQNSGGIAAINQNGSAISDCYNTGAVVSGNGAGGVAGTNNGNMYYCYNTGSINCPQYVGGLMGQNSGTVASCFWNIETSGQNSSPAGEGRSTDQMTYAYASDTFADWDWSIWKPDVSYSVNAGYPYLRPAGEIPVQPPEPAVNLVPAHLAASVLPSVTLAWNSGFSDTNTDPPSGFLLFFGTDNPPANLANGLDLAYQRTYDPLPDLSLYTTYFWKIVPYNSTGQAADCPVWTFSTYDPNYTLSYPNGGELWLSGTTQTIRWDAANANPASQLFISFDNGSNWTPLTTVDGTEGFYHLQVPAVSSTQCLVKISSMDGTYSDVSNSAFSISTSSAQPKVLLTYPSASGVLIRPGTEATVTWTRQNVTLVALDLSTDGGNTWMEFATSIDAASYLWTVSNTPSTACRIRVRSVANGQVLDISNYDFTIARIDLLTPDGGEVLTGDYSGFGKFNITWEAAAVSNVKIEYSPNGGSSWSVVNASAPAGLGLYVWTIPSDPTENGLIRVSNADYTSLNDVSSTPFTIRNPVKLLTGEGGFITNNTIFNLRWQMQDIDPDAMVLLEYSFTSFTWMSMNAVSIPVSNESYYWYANNIQSSYLYFRIVEAGSRRVLVKTVSPVTVTDMSLTLLEPAGGEEYPVSSYQLISWDCSGPQFLKIYLSTDSGSSWTLLAPSVPAGDFTFFWQTPSTPSQHCRILVMDTEHSYLAAQSETDFTVAELTSYPPAAPQNLNISIAGTDVLMNWDPVTLDTAGNPLTPDGYNIYSSPNGVDFTFVVLTGDTQFTDAGAAANSRLFYYVKAVINNRQEAGQPVPLIKRRP